MEAAFAAISKGFTALKSVQGLGTALSIAGTVSQGVSMAKQQSYQNALNARNAQIEEENAKRIAQAGGAAAKDADLEALAVLGDNAAVEGSSGFLLSSKSFARRRMKNKLIADDNRARIMEDATVQATSAQNRASSLRSSPSGGNPFLATALGVGQDLISGAAFNNRKKAAINNMNTGRVTNYG